VHPLRCTAALLRFVTAAPCCTSSSGGHVPATRPATVGSHRWRPSPSAPSPKRVAYLFEQPSPCQHAAHHGLFLAQRLHHILHRSLVLRHGGSVRASAEQWAQGREQAGTAKLVWREPAARGWVHGVRQAAQHNVGSRDCTQQRLPAWYHLHILRNECCQRNGLA
jgi:hypothetical protein